MISLWEKRTGPQLAALADGTLDIALAYGRPHSADLRGRRVLANIPIVAVVGRDHAWAGRKAIRFAELAGQDCLLFQRDQTPSMWDSICNAAAEADIELSITQYADDPGATAHMVAVKPLIGFASLPRAAAVGMGAVYPPPVPVKLVDPIPVVDLYAVWRADERNAAVGHFLDCVDHEADTEPRLVG